MRTRHRHHPVRRHHVLIALALLSVGTLVFITPISAPDKHAFLNTAEPVVASVLMSATFFLEAVRQPRTRRGAWTVLRRAARIQREFGLCVGVLCVLTAALLVSHILPLSESVESVAIDMCFGCLIDVATTYLWGLLMLPLLALIVRSEFAWIKRGAR